MPAILHRPAARPGFCCDLVARGWMAIMGIEVFAGHRATASRTHPRSDG